MNSAVKEIPLIFSPPMVLANHKGIKRMTRRVVKPQPFEHEGCWYWIKKGKHYQLSDVYTDQQDGSALFPYGPQRLLEQCPHGIPGDRLWVRERIQSLGGQTVWHDRTEGVLDGNQTYAVVRYLSDGIERTVGGQRPPVYRGLHNQKIPSIHMPRWACRDVYTVTKVRLERLHDITAADAAAEGIELKRWKTGIYGPHDPGLKWDAKVLVDGFHALWDSLNDKQSGRAWADNPWVWVVEYDNPKLRSRRESDVCVF